METAETTALRKDSSNATSTYEKHAQTDGQTKSGTDAQERQQIQRHLVALERNG